MREPLGITTPNQVFDTVIMGANTYRVPGALPSPYPHLHQIIVTSEPTGIPGDITVWSDDIAARVQALKQDGGGSVWVCGGGRLAASLLPHLNRLLLKVSPVILGEGIPLFGRATGGRPAFHPGRQRTVRQRRPPEQGHPGSRTPMPRSAQLGSSHEGATTSVRIDALHANPV